MDYFRLIAVISAVVFFGTADFYKPTVLSGSLWAEDSGSATNTGEQLSFGNGDNSTTVFFPFDIYVGHLTVTTQTSCTGTATISVTSDGVGKGLICDHTGGGGSSSSFNPPIKIDRNTKVTFNRTSGCSSGGAGMVATMWYTYTLPDSIILY